MDLYVVKALDGQPKRWMWDSRWFELTDGGEGIFPKGAALQALSFFTTRREFGESETTVDVTPYSGQAMLQAAAPKFQDEDGTEYRSLPELIAAVKARAVAAVQSGPPPIPAREELDELRYADLVTLATAYGISVESRTSAKVIVEALEEKRLPGSGSEG